LEVEEILRWILDAAKDDKADIDDILMAGQHRTVCPHAARATTKRTHIKKNGSTTATSVHVTVEPILQFFKALPPSLD
jgi:hypothetical protein